MATKIQELDGRTFPRRARDKNGRFKTTKSGQLNGTGSGNAQHHESFVLYRRDGSKLTGVNKYEGETDNAALNRLIKKRRKEINYKKRTSVDWTGVDLSPRDGVPFDISNQDISDFNLDGADLTDLVANDVTANRTNLSRVTAHRTKLRGLKSEEGGLKAVCTDFLDGDLSNSILVKPYLRGIKLRGNADADDPDDPDAGMFEATGMNWDSPILTQSELDRVNCRGSVFTNGDWGSAVLTRNNFIKARFPDTTKDDINAARTGMAPLEGHEFQDKMRDTIMVGNRLSKGTKTNAMNDKDLTKQKKSNARRGFLTATAVLALFAPGAFGMDALMNLSEIFPKNMNALQVIGSIFVVDFVKQNLYEKFIEDRVKDKLQDFMINRRKEAKETGARFKERLKHFNWKLLIGDKNSMMPIVAALQAVKKRKGPKASEYFKYLVAPQAKPLMRRTDIEAGNNLVVVCDQKHLAEAIAHISSNRDNGFAVRQNITLVRENPEDSSGGIASTVTFLKSGETEMTWVENGATRFCVYFDADGMPTRTKNFETGETQAFEDMPVPHVTELHDALDAFERKVLDDNDLSDFDYDPEKNYVVAGEKGSIFVHDKVTRDLHNELGPAIVTTNNAKAGRFAFLNSTPNDDALPQSRRPSWHTREFFLQGVARTEHQHAVETKPKSHGEFRQAVDRVLEAHHGLTESLAHTFEVAVGQDMVSMIVDSAGIAAGKSHSAGRQNRDTAPDVQTMRM